MGLVSSWNYKRKPLLPLMATKAFCKKKHILGNWYMEEILIIEDDELLNDGLCFHLQKAGYRPSQAYSIGQAEAMLETKSWSLFLMDINFPEGDGLKLLEKIRQKNKAPVILLTARDMDEDIIKGFAAGADDYVTKPFNIKILIQRIQAILRRCEPQNTKDVQRFFGELEIDFETMTVKKKGVLLYLTPTEYKLLVIFCKNPGQILTRQLLLEKLWDLDGNYVDGHALAVNISRLRKKIENGSGTYIKTVYGMGYQWMKEGKDE